MENSGCSVYDSGNVYWYKSNFGWVIYPGPTPSLYQGTPIPTPKIQVWQPNKPCLCSNGIEVINPNFQVTGTSVFSGKVLVNNSPVVTQADLNKAMKLLVDVYRNPWSISSSTFSGTYSS